MPWLATVGSHPLPLPPLSQLSLCAFCFPQKHNAGKNQRLVSRELGVAWKAMTPDAQAPYFARAEFVKALFEREYPGHKFRRRRKSEGKTKGLQGRAPSPTVAVAASNYMGLEAAAAPLLSRAYEATSSPAGGATLPPWPACELEDPALA